MFVFTLLFLFVLRTAASSVSPPGQGRNHCVPVDFHLSATAQNFVYSNPPDPNNVTDVLAFMVATTTTGVATNGTQSISGTFKIHGVYCKPTKQVRKNSDTLQLLVHGVTYNSTMWGGYGFGDQYNWHVHANNEGYHTLAIDRLGHGLSTRTADPLSVVQSPMHAEIIHQLIKAVRTNSAANVIGKKFKKVAYVGHSFGSQIGTQILRVYPNDVDAAVLTGWSTFVNFTAVNEAFRWEPAAIHDPSRFAGVAYGYVTMTQEASRTAGFYGGGYDPAIPAVDFAYEDITTDGDLGSNLWLLQPSTGHNTPVMVVTGVNDALFCPSTQSGCDAALANSQQSFPNLTRYEYYAPANTGHDLTLHYSAQTTFKKVHKSLDKWL